MKKWIVYSCLICLLLGLLPLGAMATEVETTEATEAVEVISRESNSCGDDLTWSFSGGVLTITGSGEMDDYITEAPPWANHKHDITKLVFTGGVSYIGAYAFTDYDELTSVDFGSSMHTIGEQAFYSCDGLTSITLPASFRCFGKECFMSCTSLKEVWCQGGMPSFRGSCLWDTYATIYYPPNNPWPAEPVLQLLDSFQYRITIQAGTPGNVQQTTTPAPTQATEPPVTEAPTEPPTEAPTVPATIATEPVETTQETQAPTVKMTEPEWLNETYEAAQEEKPEKKASFTGLWFGLFLITGILCLILLGALIFRRRRY